ncbi:MAG: Ig-like domain-containing protein [Acetivibrio ethanolgignens]
MKKRIMAFLLAVIFLLGGIPVKSQAAMTKKANIRFVFTTDLHGQLTTTNYETGGEYSSGGLSRAYTLLEKARNEKGKENTFTFDLGDTIYDYSTEYIYMAEPDTVQPIYKAMATIGYDAVTLGNHDFDYGFSYIKNQIKGAGLSNICVVSNVVDANTKKHVWKENMLLSRKVKASDGTTMTVKVGVIGETIPKLSTKTESYTAVLETEDIVQNVEAQANKLKAKGADIVVVLAHSGFGKEEPEYMDKDVSYALTKIKNVDVVLCGHNHINFPSTDVNAESFYKLNGVNKATGLVNGKNLVMCSDRGKGIGVADFTIQKTGSTVKISNRKSEVRKVVDKKPVVNKTLNENFMGKWENILKGSLNNEVGRLAYGEQLENYFGLLEDSKAIELVNEAKISYALNYIHNINPEYRDYPVIAATHYKSFGQEDAQGYIDLEGSISEAELSKLQAYNGYINLYTITGTQLREWLEWTASAYAAQGISDNQSNDYLKPNTLLYEEWQNDWAGAYIFDGIEYKINTLVPPRYSRSGSKISNSQRITSLTRNGVEIKDSDRLVLAVDRLTGVPEVIRELTGQTIYTKYNRSQVLLMDYLNNNFKNITIPTKADHNWSLLFNPEVTYRLEGGAGSEKVAKTKPWYKGSIGTQYGYYYYEASFSNLNQDVSGPLVVARSLNDLTTNKDVKIAVQANDVSGVKRIAYLSGKHTVEENYIWDSAVEITGSTFEVMNNGIYSIMAEDTLGNRNVTYVVIENINRGTLEVPRVETYTNRKTKIAGTAEPGTTIYFEIGGSKYETQVGNDGKFSYALPSQEAGTEIVTYVKDEYGRSSSRLGLLVKRTGPNYPVADEIANNQTKITGSMNDQYVKPVVLIGSKAYVASQDVALFKESEIYKDNYSIVKTTVSVDSEGCFTMKIPAQRDTTAVKLYTIDSAGRASRVYKSTVIEAAPNKPSLYAVTNIEKKVYGYVYNRNGQKSFDIQVENGLERYTGTTDEKGYFEIPTGALKEGDVIKVYAFDTADDGTQRKSAQGSLTVKDINEYVGVGGELELKNITDKVISLKGSYDTAGDRIYLKIGSQYTEVSTAKDGSFTVDLEEALSAGTSIYALTRYEKGGIADAAKIQVVKGLPFQPEIKNTAIYNNTMNLIAESEEDCTLYAMINGKKYTSGLYEKYDADSGMYQYRIKIPKTNSGAEVAVYAKNSAGKSKAARTVIIENAPDTPKVNGIKENSEKITGTVHLILPGGAEEENPTVENTGTQVFAKIGSKEYKAKIKEDGSFSIKIPKQKKKTKIIVWAVNDNGTGPKKTFAVK